MLNQRSLACLTLWESKHLLEINLTTVKWFQNYLLSLCSNFKRPNVLSLRLKLIPCRRWLRTCLMTQEGSGVPDLSLSCMRSRALSIQPKIPVISVGTSNGTDHFGLVRPEYSGPALKVVHCDRSGHFGRSDRNVPFHLPKLLSPVPLFSILLTRPSSFQWKVKCCE